MFKANGQALGEEFDAFQVINPLNNVSNFKIQILTSFKKSSLYHIGTQCASKCEQIVRLFWCGMILYSVEC